MAGGSYADGALMPMYPLFLACGNSLVWDRGLMVFLRSYQVWMIEPAVVLQKILIGTLDSYSLTSLVRY